MKFIVCNVCEGEGQITPDGILDGLEYQFADSWEDRDAFVADVLAGRYDVACRECGGLRVVRPLSDEGGDKDAEYYEAMARLGF
jgi:hypothetical protein